MGARAARLAHRVLGDGGGACSASASTSTAAASTCSSPTTRTRRRRPAAPAARELAALLDAQRDARGGRRREDVEVARQHRAAARGARPPRPRCADPLLRERPLPPADRLRRGAARRGRGERRADPRRGAAAGRRARRRSSCGRCATASSRRSPTTSTRRARSPRCGSGSARPTAASEPVGRRATCARCSACSALENLLEVAGRAGRGRRARAERASGRARRGRLRARRRAARADRGARLVGARHADGGFELTPAGVIVYGRNAVREALRGRRASTVAEILATEALAREPWLAQPHDPRRARPRRSSGPAARASTRAICAELAGYPYVSTGELLARRVAADRRARRGPGPAEPRRDLPHGRVRRRERRRDLRAARRRGHPGGLPRLGGRGRASADRAGAQPRRLPARRARAPAAGATARRPRRSAIDYTAAGLPGRRRDRVRRRGARAAPARRGELRRARRAAAAGRRSARSTSTPRPARCCTRCCSSARPLTGLHNCG